MSKLGLFGIPLDHPLSADSNIERDQPTPDYDSESSHPQSAGNKEGNRNKYPRILRSEMPHFDSPEFMKELERRRSELYQFLNVPHGDAQMALDLVILRMGGVKKAEPEPRSPNSKLVRAMLGKRSRGRPSKQWRYDNIVEDAAAYIEDAKRDNFHLNEQKRAEKFLREKKREYFKKYSADVHELIRRVLEKLKEHGATDDELYEHSHDLKREYNNRYFNFYEGLSAGTLMKCVRKWKEARKKGDKN